MPGDALVIVAGMIWLGGLFGVALWGERTAIRGARANAIIYALSLAVYCTSWTFYGTVTQASQSGWWLPPTFVGTIVLYLFAARLMAQLVRVVREHNSTSIADLIATRFGRSSGLAALVTGVAVLGIVPYIALQLKAVAMSYVLLTHGRDAAVPAWKDSALYVALAMALFAMLFGTRRASVVEHNRGLVLAIAFEGVLKLGAMLALGAFALSVGSTVGVTPPAASGGSGFSALVLLGGFAMFTLPHQFHVGVVECREPRQIATARWLFPLYLLLIGAPVLPLARLGDALLASRGVPPDLYVLSLPLAFGNHALALLAFLGGLSSATGMVIVATLALSLMIGNHWLAPLLLRAGWGQRDRGDLRPAVLIQRRVAIVSVVLLAWGYSRAVIGSEALADIGAVSFSALAALGPAVIAAVYWPQLGARAAAAGIIAGIGVWSYSLLLPVIVQGIGYAPDWIARGPFGIDWLGPDNLFGLHAWGRLNRAVVISLGANLVAMGVAAQWFRSKPERELRAHVNCGDLRHVAARFLADERVRALFDAVPATGAAPEALVAAVEHDIAAVIGAASARLLVDAARRERGRKLDAVAAMLGEASQDLRFNQRLLGAALENMSQGISVVDRDLTLVAWNRRYASLFGYPPELLQVGVPVAELVRFNIRRSFAANDENAQVEKRLTHMRNGTPYVAERCFPDGTVVEIRGNPMPGGGFVATFTDVTEFRRTEAELKRAAETLEQRVVDRTAELLQAKAEAERANQAKSRFLAAVSHDLAQPLNAAHLFTHALAQQLKHEQYREGVNHIDSALSSAEDLLGALLDISRLDAGGLTPRLQTFCLDDWMRHLAAEFGVLAREKGLQLHWVPSRAWLRSDPQLLRRVVQNFLTNAVRYTEHGRVLFGCRRVGDAMQIQVWDTGPGITESDRAVIFEEFRRLHQGGQGLGLGLAIAERIARLLDHPLTLRSQPGRGTSFTISVPRAAAGVAAIPAPALPPAAPQSRVFVVDNDPAVLQAMRMLLSGWGCQVQLAATVAEAERLIVDFAPDLLLLDFHLDGAATGLDLQQRLTAIAGDIACVIITANHDESVRRAVMDQGCYLLYKPLKPLALKSIMARLLSARAAAPLQA